LIDGEAIMTPSPLFVHQKISMNFALELTSFVRRNGLGEVVTAPMDVHLNETECYQPDIIFIGNENRSIIGDRIHGAPDLVVEILSESSAYHDLKHKKRVYEACGVKEYWILDPMEKSIEVFENKSGRFVPYVKGDSGGTVASALLAGFFVSLEDVFRI
jgi:Uma2 family endonuclease